MIDDAHFCYFYRHSRKEWLRRKIYYYIGRESYKPHDFKSYFKYIKFPILQEQYHLKDEDLEELLRRYYTYSMNQRFNNFLHYMLVILVMLAICYLIKKFQITPPDE